MKYIVCAHQIFNENAECLSQKIKVPITSTINAKEGDVYIIFGAHMIADKLLMLQREVKVGFIILNSEPENNMYLKNKYYITLMKSNPVFCYDKPSGDHLKQEFGFNCFSSFFFEFMKIDHDGERPIDILFVGTQSPVRVAIRDNLKKKYPDKKIEFVFDGSLLDANKMKQALALSKVCLNIPFYNNDSLETHRIHNALSCGCNVLSYDKCDETIRRFYEPYVTFCSDIVDFDIDSIAEKGAYEDLVKMLSQLFYPHMLFTINKICGDSNEEGETNENKQPKSSL